MLRDDLPVDIWSRVASTVTISAAGRDLAYQWYADGDPIPGANTDTLALAGIANGAQIWCVVSGGGSSVTTSHATVHTGENPAASISVQAMGSSVDKDHLAVGDTLSLYYVVTPTIESNPSVSTSKVTLSVADTSVATLSGDRLTACGQGTTTVTATTDNGCSASLTVTVDSWRVCYRPMGGSFSDGSTADRTERVTAGRVAQLPTVWCEGDTFLGWSEDGSTPVTQVVMEHNVTLLALWESANAQEDEDLEIVQDLADTQYARIGDNALFEVVTNGAKVRSYQWQANDGSGWSDVLSGATSDGARTSLEVPATGANDGWRYRVVVTAFRDNAQVTSNECELRTGETDVPQPAITFLSQPVYAEANEGGDTSFSVAVCADEPAYQWQASADGTDWADVEGETGETLALTGVTADMSGRSYRCVVTAGGESATSASATLTVHELREFTVAYDAAGGAFADGDATRTDVVETYSESAIYAPSGEEPTYPWHSFAGWALDGQAVETVTLTGDVTLTALWDDAPELEFVASPESQQAAEGSDVTLSASAMLRYGEDDLREDAAITYCWQFSATGDAGSYADVDGATGTTLTVTAGQEVVGYYRAVATWGTQEVTSEAAQLTIASAACFETDLPSEMTVAVGQEVTLSVALDGDHSAGASYQWYEGDGAVGSDQPTHTFTASASQDGHAFRCVATCDGQTVDSTVMTLHVAEPELAITGQPQALTVRSGKRATFTVGASLLVGDEAIEAAGITYQWQRRYASWPSSSWSDISGATAASYGLTAYSYEAMYVYRAVVSWNGQAVSSDAASLTVVDPLTFSTDLEARMSAQVGETVALAVATNYDGSEYQWFTEDDGGNSEQLECASGTCELVATADMNGHWFYCRATNDGDVVESSHTKLIVGSTVTSVSIEASQYRIDLDPWSMQGELRIYASVSDMNDYEGHDFLWQESYDDESWEEAFNDSYGDPTTFVRYVSAEETRYYRLIVDGVASNSVMIETVYNGGGGYDSCPECGGSGGYHEPWCSMGGGM